MNLIQASRLPMLSPRAVGPGYSAMPRVVIR